MNNDYDDDGTLRVHGGYFSGDSGQNADEREAGDINLILNNKTRLLSTDESLRFIFSVWALQEGWDNPNIFNICKLAPSDVETSRRQQVGRGLRLAVNQQGRRQTWEYCERQGGDFRGINTLDVIVSSQEGDFIKELQGEINENSFGLGGNVMTFATLQPWLNSMQAIELVTFLRDNKIVTFSEEDDNFVINRPPEEFIRNNREKLPPNLAAKCDQIVKFFEDAARPLVESGNKKAEMIGIRANRFKEFEELWDTITRKAEIFYRNIAEDKLIDAINAAFNKETIDKALIIKTRKVYDHESNTIKIEAVSEEIVGEIDFSKDGSYPNFALKFAKDENLPIAFVSKLFAKLDRDKIENDPAKAYGRLREIVNDEIHRNVIQSVEYDFNSRVYVESRNVFYDDNGSPRTEIEAGKIGRYPSEGEPADHYLYDRVRYDSSIEEEASLKASAFPMGDYGTVQVFAKLPRISIPTPYKTYSPDFAYFIRTDKGKKIFFVAETKGYDSESTIPDDDKLKVEYAKRFFEELNNEVAGSDIKVVFKQRINKQSMLELLKEVGSQG